MIFFPNHIIKELQKLQKEFLWRTKISYIKHGTLFNSYKQGVLKNMMCERKSLAVNVHE